MADTVSDQEELSMEDILSSIKGILSDEGPEPKKEEKTTDNAPAEPKAETPVISPETVEKDDDVFDLSASMIVDIDAKDPAVKPVETDSLTVVETPEMPIIDLDSDFNGLSRVDDINLEDLDRGSDADVSDSLSGAFSINDNEEDILSLNSVEVQNPNEIDIDSEPIYSPEDENISEAAVIDEEPVIDVDSEPVYEMPEKTAAEIENKAAEPQKEEPATDVSADMIDNFARMFTESKPAVTVSAAPETKIGDASLTIADMVKAVIADSLQPVIEKSLSGMDAEILGTVRAEASAQAKKWVDENLTRVVEEVVKEEVKRVMAKVGS